MTRRTTALSLLLLGSLASVPTLAQPKPAVAISEEAKRYFKAGVDFLNDPDGARYEEAYRSFKQAYASTPSWKILGNLGLSAMKLERLGEAIEAYEKYLAESGSEIDATERAQIEKDVRLMKAASATVALTAGSAEVSVVDQRQKANGSMAVNAYVVPAGKTTTFTLQAGRHVMTAKFGGKEEKWEIELSAGQSAARAFKLDASGPVVAPAASSAAPAASSAAPAGSLALDTSKPPSSSTLRTAGFVSMGVGGAMILGGVVTGLMGKSKLSQLESDCPDKRCSPDKQSDADSIKSLQTMTNVLWIGGAVVAGAGAAMFVIGSKKTDEAAARVRVVPVAASGGGGLFATGRF